MPCRASTKSSVSWYVEVNTRVGSGSPPSSGRTNPSPGASFTSRSTVSFILRAYPGAGSRLAGALRTVSFRLTCAPVRLSLTPKTSEFFVLFARAGENALEVARLVDRRFREHPNSGITQEQVKAAETVNDGVTHDLIQLLNTQYLTPFDRDDIHMLAIEIDDVIDELEEASDLLGLYGIELPTKHAVQQTGLIVSAAEQLSIACDNLKSFTGVQQALVELKRLEDEGDRVNREGLAPCSATIGSTR